MITTLDPQYEPHAFEGMCNVCGWQGLFERKHRSPRETYSCGQCRSSLRYRAQAEAILTCSGRPGDTLIGLVESEYWRSLKVYEPGVTGPFRKIFGPSDRYFTSFYWDDVAPGGYRDGVICQNIMATTYADGEFDFVITSDIFEHVRHPLDGLLEVRRILAPGGFHVWTVPAMEPFPAKTISRIDTSTSEDVPLLPLVYHGSGITGGKSVVYTDFGQDVIQQLNDLEFPTVMARYKPCREIGALITFISSKS